MSAGWQGWLPKGVEKTLAAELHAHLFDGDSRFCQR